MVVDARVLFEVFISQGNRRVCWKIGGPVVVQREDRGVMLSEGERDWLVRLLWVLSWFAIVVTCSVNGRCLTGIAIVKMN